MDVIDSITSIQHIIITLAFPAGPFSFSSLSSVSPLLLRSSALTLRSRWDTCQKATQPHAANSWARHTQFTAGGKDMLLCEYKAPCVSHSVLSDIKIYKGLVLLQNTKVLKEQWWDSPCSHCSLDSWEPSCIWPASLLTSPPSAIWSSKRRALRWSSLEHSWSGDSARK